MQQVSDLIESDRCLNISELVDIERGWSILCGHRILASPKVGMLGSRALRSDVQKQAWMDLSNKLMNETMRGGTHFCYPL